MMWHEDLEELDLPSPCGYAMPCDTHTHTHTDAMALYETCQASGNVANGKNAMIDAIIKLVESESRIIAKTSIILMSLFFHAMTGLYNFLLALHVIRRIILLLTFANCLYGDGLVITNEFSWR